MYPDIDSVVMDAGYTVGSAQQEVSDKYAPFFASFYFGAKQD